MQGGVQGSIRSWVRWDDIGTILYNIKDNQWCGHINRAHRSNGIYIIADLQAGLSAPEQPRHCCNLWSQQEASCPVGFVVMVLKTPSIRQFASLDVLSHVASMIHMHIIALESQKFSLLASGRRLVSTML